MKKKIIIIAVIIIAIIIAVVVFLRKNTTNNERTVSQNTQTTESGSNNSTNKGNNENKQNKETAKVETKYEGVVENGVYVIEKCITSEENLVVPDKINGAPVGKIIGNAFMDVPSKTIKLPDTVTAIGHAAFMHCKNLEKIDLGNSLKWIGQSAFQGCPKLLNVTFPDGLTTIEGAIFIADTSIGEVYIPATATNIVSIGFTDDCPNLVVVTPKGSRAEEVAKEAGVPVRNK